MSEQQTHVTAIRIEQMDCPTEERLLRKALEKKPGVSGLRFNLMSRVLSVTHEPAVLDDVMQAIRKIGFTPELHDGKPATPRVAGKIGCCGHSHDTGHSHIAGGRQEAHDHAHHQHDHADHDHNHDHGPGQTQRQAQSAGEVSPNIGGGVLPAWWHLGLGGVLALASELVHWFSGPAWLTIICAVAAVALAGTATYRKGCVIL